MRIAVFAWDFPYPPRGGGRADVWRRIEGLLQLGHEVMLVNQVDPAGPRVPGVDDLSAVDARVQARFSFAIRRGRWRSLRRLVRVLRVPWRVATRVPDRDEYPALLEAVARFDPDLLWLDGPWFGEVVRRIRRERDVPIAYRSHNLEHTYLRRQAAAAARLRNRLAWRLAALGLRRYQLALMQESAAVFDISQDDLRYWRRHGVEHVGWLPPLPELALTPPSDERVSCDVVFVGGLRTPNNQQGVRWLVREVRPLVLRERPGTTFGVVGSYPDPGLAAELDPVPEVVTFYDVPDVTPYQFGARVLANPVAVGSGVQLKVIDMLMTEAPIVSRSQGLAGLPASCAAQVRVADTAEEFAAAIVAALDDPAVDPVSRDGVRALFGVGALGEALERVRIATDRPS
ncbi:glycosyltransferase [Pseudonocardia sp. WMMC193]|uniref:glycosyltransferase n=1 Tax=Pseudonocardia sp. WMMC193 TaxID=2911965 RepID=UPI001F40A0E1|nr:glycosyltransferase [Pseudonocardia sp. WMMC193]MCF7553854.1 glycosyltransferase family 4 protein [Pseudonocardia sp. WMMC193]